MVAPLQASFGRGEITPLAQARQDLAFYAVALARCENWIVLPYGGVTRRPGTRFVAHSRDDGRTRLIPFLFSTEQAYVLAFSDGRMRVFKDRGAVLDAAGDPVEIATPYGADDAFELHYAQSADVMYLAHRAHPPQRLSRTGHASWTLAPVAFTNPPADWTANPPNWPARVSFFEDRLVWAAPPSHPQTLYFSRTGDFETMTTGAGDDDGMQLTISAGQVNAIQWLAEDQELQIGTTAATRTLSGGGPDTALTPTSIRQRRNATFGCAPLRPVQTGEATLFVGAYGRRLREMAFSLEADRFLSPDLSLLAEHLTETGIVDLAYEQDPHSIVWLCRADGLLVGLTFDRAQQMVAWHRHRIAGGRADPDGGAVESVAVIPGEDRDELWLTVRRTVAGRTVRHIEYLDAAFVSDGEVPLERAHFVDSGLLYDGAPATGFGNLAHLDGEDVAILADGAVSPARRVIDGAITLANDQTAACAHVGLPFRSLAETLRPALDSAGGSALGRRKRISAVVLDVFRTHGLKVGPDESGLELVVGRRADDPMDAPPRLRTGEVEVAFDGGWETPGRLVFVQDDPLPATVRAIVPIISLEG